MGSLAILNVGAGDTKLSFDPKNPREVERSAKIVEDMLRRGFVLLIEVGRDDRGPLYRRAEGFDPTTSEYIVAGDPPADLEAPTHEEAEAEAEAPAARKAPRKRKTGGRWPKDSYRIPAATTNAVAVARTAGG